MKKKVFSILKCFYARLFNADMSSKTSTIISQEALFLQVESQTIIIKISSFEWKVLRIATKNRF